MNRMFFKVLLHAAIGGFGAGLMMIPAGAPLTTETVLYPAFGSALTSILSLFSRAPSGAQK